MLPSLNSTENAGSAQLTPQAQAQANQNWNNFVNMVVSDLPRNMWSGTPLRNFFGVTPAYATDYTPPSTNTGGSTGSSMRDQFNPALNAGTYKGRGPNSAWVDLQAKCGILTTPLKPPIAIKVVVKKPKIDRSQTVPAITVNLVNILLSILIF